MNETRKRNPAWTRDELILALDFYVRYSPKIPEKTSSEIAGFSNLLNNLAGQISGYKNEKFRNANGVYMKLMNFRRFDPNVSGKGLQREVRMKRLFGICIGIKLMNLAKRLRLYAILLVLKLMTINLASTTIFKRQLRVEF